MRTVLIAGDVPAPRALRELIERGSTSFVEHRAADLVRDAAGSAAALDADRIVFWSASDDADVERLAEWYANAEAAARREIVVFVTAEGVGATPSAKLAPHEVFLWPRDEDRLKMAFLTGA